MNVFEMSKAAKPAEGQRGGWLNKIWKKSTPQTSTFRTRSRCEEAQNIMRRFEGLSERVPVRSYSSKQQWCRLSRERKVIKVQGRDSKKEVDCLPGE